jgi:hypothetical protein
VALCPLASIAGGLFLCACRSPPCGRTEGAQARPQGGGGKARKKGVRNVLAGKRVKALIAALSAVIWITTCCGVAFADDIGPVYDAGDHSDGGGGHDIEVPRIVQGPTMLSADGYEVCVYAFDRFTAAFLACGYDYEDYQLLSDDAKALLSNADTGGAFYTFAQSMTQPTPYLVTNLLYGFDSVWYGRYTYELQRDARQAIQDAIDGNTGGGGDGTDVTAGIQDVIDLTAGYGWFVDNAYTGPSQPKHNAEDYVIKIHLNEQVKNYIKQYATVDINYIYVWYGVTNHPWGCNTSYSILVSAEPLQIEVISGEGEYNRQCYNLVFNGDKYNRFYNINYDVNNKVGEVPIELTFTYIGGFETKSGRYQTDSGWYLNGLWYNGAVSPTVPPTNWPDEQQPTQPTQPSVPDAPTNEPTTQPNEPSTPTVEPYPVIVYQPDTTYTQPDLSAVLDALNEHCKHLQTAIHNGFSNFWTKLNTLLNNLSGTFNRFLAQQLKWVVDSFNDSLQNLMWYLKSLFEWLAEQFYFTFTGNGYDDNTVVSWLIKIYSRLGSGINLRPADPVADPDGVGDWLSKLFNNLINVLLSLGNGIIDAIEQPLEQLTHKFPFSIPWDIAAILGMLVADPVVPVITMPSYALVDGGISHVADYVIDLTPYDAYVGGIRLMIKLAFTVYLIMNAGKFMDMLDKVVGTDA